MSDREIIAVRYGTREMRRSEVFYDYARLGEPDAAIGMAYYFWLIRDANETIVIDSGFSARAARKRGREIIISPADALARIGVDPASVPSVILTHVHYDHTGNLDLFKNARFFMSRTEFDFIAGPFADRPPFAAVMEAEDNAFVRSLYDAGRIDLVGPEHRLRDGIDLVEMPGHSPGELSVIVTQPKGPVVLASDAVHYYEELERDRPFAIMSSLLDMYRSYVRLRDILAQPGAVLVPGHDPDVMRRFPRLDDASSEFAVRVG